MIALMVILAGSAAAVVRYGVTLAFPVRGFPWAVFVVNVVGSAIGGAAVGLADAGLVSTDLRLVLLGGVAGGLTTFSTWSVETIQLITEGRWRTAAASVGGGLAVGLAAAASAYALALALGTALA